MSRRDQTRTDDSTYSATDSLRSLMATGLRYAAGYSGLEFLDDTMLKSYGPEQILRRMLSTKSYISTTSSNAVRNQKALADSQLQAMVKLGQGQCGTVYSVTGVDMVLKLANEGKVDQLFNDCTSHVLIEEAFQSSFIEFRRDINIPRCHGWVHPTKSPEWNDYLRYFPTGFKPTFALKSQRVYPLPLPVRSAIVDAFAPSSVKRAKEAFLAHPSNKNCLVRLYLGRRLQRGAGNTFKLSNFDLMVNEMEYLRLDTNMYAATMAKALAVLHWKAGMDGNDVEFILGSTPMVTRTATGAEYLAANYETAADLGGQTTDFTKRSVSMWLIDFNECKSFNKDDDGMRQLVRAFYFNDPYYPRPVSGHANDKALWTVFKTAYLATSVRITSSRMPGGFIAAVETEGRRRSETGSLFG